MNQTYFNFTIDKQFEYENGFYLTSHQTRIAKIIAHYELYKKILHLPGQIVECGVYKGVSLIRFLTFREMLENPFSRKIIGFDIFGDFPRSGDQNDLDFINKFESAGGSGIPKDELEKVFDYKGFTNYELVQGDILKTLPDYIDKNKELKIALLHIDVDVYRPTKMILEKLYDKVVVDGIIIFDDYSSVAGETIAVDEFFENKTIEKLPISHTPSFIKKSS